MILKEALDTALLMGKESKLFLEDVKKGLGKEQKQLSSKYFYDQRGDELFQSIMELPEYYLTRSEMEIFQNKAGQIIEAIGPSPFDLIELGAGDGIKTSHLLKSLKKTGIEFTFMPIDISGNILHVLQQRLSTKLEDLKIECLQGDYFEMLERATKLSPRRKVVLMLGGNIGNMPVEEALGFCSELRRNLSPGDMVIIGFDLKKHPRTILKAYDDSSGVTAAFNLNLLRRINTELGGDFDLDQFEHYQTYDPQSGACKSFLVSLCDQTVSIDGSVVHFQENESIFMEVSQKFSTAEIGHLASSAGFKSIKNIKDSKGWFADAIWKI